MAQLPRRFAPDLSALAAALLLAVWPAAAWAELDLAGTWHVLVHYRDANTSNPEADRWEDRLWEFEPKGDRLRWTEFPIVVFEDEGGRFERRAGSGHYARVIHSWEPSPEQLANIRAGLAVNDRGAQTKTLRRNGEGWSSATRASPMGASVITYQETWSIEDPDGLPAFEQVDLLGSESAESMEGRTVLRTERIAEDGDLLVGSFDRDGTRRGTFQLRRAGERRELAKKTQSELQQQGFARGIMSSEEARRVIEPARGELAKAGIELDEEETSRLVRKALELLAQGEAPDEVQRRLVESVKEERGSESPPAPEAGR